MTKLNAKYALFQGSTRFYSNNIFQKQDEGALHDPLSYENEQQDHQGKFQIYA